MITAKAAVFDTDGTLIDTTKRFFTVFKLMLEKRGQDPIEWGEFFKRYSEDTLNEVIKTRETSVRKQEIKEFWLEFLKKYREIPFSEDSMIEGVKETLERIDDSGAKIGITTSCILPPSKLKRELEEYDLAKYADTIITGGMVIEDLIENHHFSKRKIFERAFEELGVNPEETVVVGDYRNDITAGKDLGSKTVAVQTGHMKTEILEGLNPDNILKSVKDLPLVVKFNSN
ncbi:MAG: HAD family hydrolase [Hadesarchaea archaeon]|nr:HAD family hydrolase [Hadesarchaea archaeon]